MLISVHTVEDYLHLLDALHAIILELLRNSKKVALSVAMLFILKKKKKEKNYTEKKTGHKAYDDTLPKWVYVIVFGIVLAVIIAILFH